MRRRVGVRIPEYLSAWDEFRRSAERAGWRAWLFRGRGGVWLEFLEGEAADRADRGTDVAPATAAAEERVAQCGELVEESWWDEMPPGGDHATDATGG